MGTDIPIKSATPAVNSTQPQQAAGYNPTPVRVLKTYLPWRPLTPRLPLFWGHFGRLRRCVAQCVCKGLLATPAWRFRPSATPQNTHFRLEFLFLHLGLAIKGNENKILEPKGISHTHTEAHRHRHRHTRTESTLPATHSP